MNDQTSRPITGEKLSAFAFQDAWKPLDRGPEVQEMLDRIALQSRKIEVLERILTGLQTGDDEHPDVVRLQPGLQNTARLAEAPARRRLPTPPWWPARQQPSYALEPSPGAQCFHLKGSGAKVLGIAVFGLSGAQIEKEVARIARQQLQLGDFIPVFLTDAKDHEVFRRHHYVFEYFPSVSGHNGAIDTDVIQPRLDLIEEKWGVDLFINLGLPRGELVRRDTRPLRERYLLAKAHFLAQRYGHAKRLMSGFTDALNAEARYRVHGRPIDNPRASIIVVSHIDHPGVKDGLASIAAQIAGRDIEIILVDNGNGALGSHGKKLFKNFGLAEPGFNSGCSAARNVGAHFARGPYLIFLDDDGIATEGCVEALLLGAAETKAVSVRGKVLPITAPERTGTHYDLGPARIPALNTTEGVSAWARKPFVDAGGFDPLLAGHEGVELCSRMWRFHGPAGFIYEPSAVLLHDYAPDANSSESKKQRYRANTGYLDSLGTRWKDINAGHHRLISDPLLGYLAMRKPEGRADCERRSVSILTTAKDGMRFLEEYSKSLRAQTDGDFEIIFVDDHSQDGTEREIRRLWNGDERMKVFASPGFGRGAALNCAMSHAAGDICLIADVDDLSVPERVTLTRNYFAENPEMDCLSFVAFNETNPFRLGPPRSLFVEDVSVRSLFGMPVSFPTFAFIRQKFEHPFNEELKGGIDCDWMFRRSEIAPLKGKIVFFPAVYYREHEGQITATRKGTQLDVRKQAIAASYARVLGELTPVDLETIHVLTDTRQATQPAKAHIVKWVAAFLQANRKAPVFDPGMLDEAMFEAVREIKVI